MPTDLGQRGGDLSDADPVTAQSFGNPQRGHAAVDQGLPAVVPVQDGGDDIGDSLLAVGDDELIKVHYHTNEPWQVLEYCAGLGDIYDIVVENMQRQSDGLDG